MRPAEFRAFNRFYTRRIGTLDEGLLSTEYSLTEARVIYELATRNESTASELSEELSLDPGYLSRVLTKFEERKLLKRKLSKQDARQSFLLLTKKGRATFNDLNQRSEQSVQAVLDKLSPGQQSHLRQAMGAIGRILSDQQPAACVLRPHRPGDMGWVIQQHGILYANEFSWDERFEAFVARIAADFIDWYNPARERCWIAEREGERLGCVFLVRNKDARDTAQLRMLLVDPAARGMGLGKALAAECTRFAREAGYKRIVLWTNSLLTAARRIYEQEGYKLTEEKPHESFGQKLIGQTWELDLTSK